MYALVSHLNLICSFAGLICGIGLLIKKRNKPIIFLALILILHSYNRFNSFTILDVSLETKQLFSFILFLLIPLNIFIPFMVLFYKESLNRQYKFKSLLLVPLFLLFFAYLLPKSFNSSNYLLNDFKNPVFSHLFTLNIDTLWYASILSLALICVTYSLISVISSIKKANIIKREINKTSALWCLSILIPLTLNSVCRNFGYWSVVLGIKNIDFYFLMRMSGDLLIDIIILNILFVSFYSPELFKNPYLYKEDKLLIKNKVKYETVNINPVKLNRLKNEVKLLLEGEKKYLNEDISPRFICDKLNIQQHILSYIINAQFNCNFYTLINRYRINYSKELIEECVFGGNEKNILDIALASGFKNKTTFNSNFKKFTGLTPSEYKKSCKLPTKCTT